MMRITAIITCLVVLSCNGGKGKECPLGTSECGGYCIDVLGSYRNCGDCGADGGCDRVID